MYTGLSKFFLGFSFDIAGISIFHNIKVKGAKANGAATILIIFRKLPSSSMSFCNWNCTSRKDLRIATFCSVNFWIAASCSGVNATLSSWVCNATSWVSVCSSCVINSRSCSLNFSSATSWISCTLSNGRAYVPRLLIPIKFSLPVMYDNGKQKRKRKRSRV